MGARHDRGVEPGILAGWMEVGMRLGRAADDDFILLGRQSQNTDFEGTFGFGEQANDNYDITHEITPRRCIDIGELDDGVGMDERVHTLVTIHDDHYASEINKPRCKEFIENNWNLFGFGTGEKKVLGNQER